jgi:hypothetical protein
MDRNERFTLRSTGARGTVVSVGEDGRVFGRLDNGSTAHFAAEDVAPVDGPPVEDKSWPPRNLESK